MQLDQIVNIQITRETATVTQQGFGRALVLGPNAPSTFNLYSSMADVAADFETSDPEYKAAQRLFGQQLRPVDIAMGSYPTPTAQISEATVLALQDADYVVTINGTAFTYTPGGTPADKSTVASALEAFVNAGSEPVVASLGGSAPNQTLVLTSSSAGLPFSATVSANLSVAVDTPDAGVNSALNALAVAGGLSMDWYALCITSRLKTDILAAAAFIESYRKIFVAATGDSDVPTSATTDIASMLKAKSYTRTVLIWSADYADAPDAALLGVVLPYTPGTINWAYKSLTGITVSTLTDTQRAYIEGKNCNCYVSIAGGNYTRLGWVSSGEWADVITGIDWLAVNAQARIFAVIASNLKVPYTDTGIDTLVNPLRSTLKQAVTLGILASSSDMPNGFVINQPAADSISATDKQTRILSGITFTGHLAGAVNAVTVVGTVSL